LERCDGDCVIASIPAALLLIIAQRYVAAGIGSGATKD